MEEIEKIIQELNIVHKCCQIQIPLNSESIKDSEYVIDLLNYLREAILGKNRNSKYNIIRNENILKYLYCMIGWVDMKNKHLVYLFIKDIFDSNTENKMIIMKNVKFDFLVDKFVEICGYNENLQNIIILLIESIYKFKLTKKTYYKMLNYLNSDSTPDLTKIELIKLLRSINNTIDPPYYFHFKGEPGTGIFMPAFPDVSKTNQFTIMIWYILRESPYRLGTKTSKKTTNTGNEWIPCLYQLNSFEGVSFSIYLTVEGICLEYRIKGKVYDIFYKMNNTLEIANWNHISTGYSIEKNQITFFIHFNGILLGKNHLGLYNLNQIRFSTCTFGKPDKLNRNAQFFGSIANIIITNNNLTSDLLKDIWSLSVNYKCDFHENFNYDSTANINNTQLEILSGLYFRNIICGIYPYFSSDNTIQDASIISVNSHNLSCNAYYSNEILIIKCSDVEKCIKLYGGISSLISLIDSCNEKGEIKIKFLVQYIFYLIELAEKYMYIKVCYFHYDIFGLLSNRIFQIKEAKSSNYLIKCLISSVKHLASAPYNKRLFNEIITKLIFNLKAWNKWSIQSQIYIIESIADGIKYNVKFIESLKNIVGIQPFVDIVLAYFDDNNVNEENSDAKIKSIRDELLSLINIIVTNDPGLYESELKILINLLNSHNNNILIKFVINVLDVSLIKNKESFGIAFCNQNAIHIFSILFTSSNESLFKNGLEFFIAVVHNSPPKSLKKLIYSHHIWCVLTYYLKNQPFTDYVFNALLRIMIDDSQFILIKNPSNWSAIEIRHTRVIQVVSWLIQINIYKNDNNSNIYGMCINFLIILKNIIHYNANSKQKLVSKVGWGGWLLSFIKIFKNTPIYSDVENIILDIVFDVLYLSLSSSPDGWIIFTDLLGYIHYFENYNNFNDISNILSGDYNNCSKCVNDILKSDTISYNSNNCIEADEKSLELKRKHFINIHISSFKYDLFFLTLTNSLFQKLKNVFCNLGSIILVNTTQLTLVKNICNIIYLTSDLFVTCFGGLSNILSFCDMTEFNLIKFSSYLITDYNIVYEIITYLCEIMSFIFVKNSVLIQFVESQINAEKGSLHRMCVRIIFCKFLLDICIKNYYNYTINSPNSSNLGHTKRDITTAVEQFFIKQSNIIAQANSYENKSLISPSTFTNLDTILNIVETYNSHVNTIVESSVYILYSLIFLYYTKFIVNKIIWYDVTKEKSLIEAIETVLGGISSLLYKTMIHYNHHFVSLFINKNGESIMDTGLKQMKTTFNISQFVMFLTSQSCQEVFDNRFLYKFNAFVTEGNFIASETIDQIEKRSCLTADHILFSSIFMHRSVISTSLWDKTFQSLSSYIIAYKKRIHYETSIQNYDTNSIDNDIISYHTSILELILRKNTYKDYNTNNIVFLHNSEDSIRRRNILIKLNDNTYSNDEKVYAYLTCVEKTLNINCLSVIDFPHDKTYKEKTKKISNRLSHNELNYSEFHSLITKIGSIKLRFNQDDCNKKISTKINCFLLYYGLIVNGTVEVSDYNQQFLFKFDIFNQTEEILEFKDFLKDEIFNFTSQQVKRVFLRSFFHQVRSVEVFLFDNRSYFFIFDNYDTAKSFVLLLPEVGIGSNYNVPLTREISLSSPCEIFEKSNISQLWCSGFISNFEYLMLLNTISGRTYHDLNQYPIFPWLINANDVSNFDFDDESNYRDFSLESINIDEESIKNWDKYIEDQSIINEGYCLNAHTVVTYLSQIYPYNIIKMKFFTNNMPSLSIKKELIPEFFYLKNIFNKDINNELKVLQLPRFVQSSEKFIELHSTILECDIISSKLHLWINRIFGLDQKVKIKEHLIYMFNYLSYYDYFYSYDYIEMSMCKEIIERIINNGISPREISKKKHPIKICNDKKIINENVIFNKIAKNYPIIYIGYVNIDENDYLLFLTVNFEIYLIKFESTMVTSRYNYYDFKINTEYKYIQISNLINHHINPQNNAINDFCLLPYSLTILIGADYIDHSLRTFNIATATLDQIIISHYHSITCFHIDLYFYHTDFYYLVVGSSDSILSLWKYDYKSKKISTPFLSNNIIQDYPILYLHGHISPITHVHINQNYLLIMSVSKNMTCCVHNIYGKLIYSFNINNNILIQVISIYIDYNGNLIIIFNENKNSYIKVYSVNGKVINSKIFDNNIKLTCFHYTKKYVIIVYVDNNIMIYNLSTLLEIYSILSTKLNITSILSIKFHHYFIIGYESGQYSIQQLPNFVSCPITNKS